MTPNDEIPVIDRLNLSKPIEVPKAAYPDLVYCIAVIIHQEVFYITPQYTLSAYQEAAATFQTSKTAVTFGKLYIYSGYMPDNVSDICVRRIVIAAPQQT